MGKPLTLRQREALYRVKPRMSLNCLWWAIPLGALSWLLMAGIMTVVFIGFSGVFE